LQKKKIMGEKFRAKKKRERNAKKGIRERELVQRGLSHCATKGKKVGKRQEAQRRIDDCRTQYS